MAAVRGRKRTEDSTPNRARDIQRAFRARRAAHLESLEDRINELEEENNYFRAMLNLPAAQRPQLGKGPTGRGLAKSRSRITVDSYGKMHDTPTPPGSEAPSTPPLECPIPLPSGHHDPYQDDLSTPTAPGSVGTHLNHSFVFPQDKMIDQYGFEHMSRSNSIDLSMGGLPSDFEAVSLDASMDPNHMHPGMFPECAQWAPVGPPPSIAIQSPDLQSASMNRAFSFTQQSAAISTQPRPMQGHHMRPTQGHRRSHTEPQSLGSVIAGFNPGHRPCSSENLVASGSPSPPPLPIRTPYQVPVYQ